VSTGGESVIVAFSLMRGSPCGVLSSLLSVVRGLLVIADGGVRVRSMSMGSRSIGVCLSSLLMLMLSYRVARWSVDMTVPEATPDLCITGVAGFHLQNIACHAVRGVHCVRGHRNARAQRMVVRVRNGSHYHVMASRVGVVDAIHNNVRMVDLTSSTNLLNRLHVNNIAGVYWNRHGLRLVKDGSNAQACKAKINVNHNERKSGILF